MGKTAKKKKTSSSLLDTLKKLDGSKKSFDAKKFTGTINWEIDPLEYQKEVREDRSEYSS
ncbi:MAG: hypothetical protein JJ895_11545 [Balneolaceae bacterium]|nr:hypothetical protein [Balneolaceae bacterium]